MQQRTILGIDVAKRSFDVTLLINTTTKSKKFSNDSQGFSALTAWLEKHETLNLQACLEATGCYGHALATYLFNQGITVSMVNPARIKAFAQSQLARNKTDKLDAKLIAQFCQLMQPAAWKPIAAPVRTLKALVHRLDNLLDIKNQERNRLDSAEAEVKPFIDAMLATIENQITAVKQAIRTHIASHDDLQAKQKLLCSISGVGEATSLMILAFLPDVKEFKHAKQAAAFAGLNPKQQQSGTSLCGRTRLSKIGNARIRKGLYMPAMTALKYNPLIINFSANLTRSGKAKSCIIGAAMRKLMHIIYGVLKSGRPFDPTHVAT